MSRRSRAREVALQLLFQQDQNKVTVRRRAVERFAADRLGEPDLAAFCLDLVDGVNKHRPELDALISSTAENWKLHRMMPVDRNVLRLGAFELLHSPDQSPVAVVLNEAIELARRFGTADSPGFVNGILDKIARGRGQETGDKGPESGDRSQESGVRSQESGDKGQEPDAPAASSSPRADEPTSPT